MSWFSTRRTSDVDFVGNVYAMENAFEGYALTDECPEDSVSLGVQTRAQLDSLLKFWKVENNFATSATICLLSILCTSVDIQERRRCVAVCFPRSQMLRHLVCCQ